MEEFKPNSHRSREADQPVEKKVEKVIKGAVKSKPKTGIERFAEVFVTADIDSVKSYIFTDVLIPAMKKAISDMVTNGIDMLLYGENGRQNRNSGNASRVSYQRYYDRQSGQTPRDPIARKSTLDYNDIVIETRGEAEDVLSRMDELIGQYGVASIADLYDMVGITGSYTDCKYGWTDIRNATIVRVPNGYLLKFPKALPLD